MKKRLLTRILSFTLAVSIFSSDLVVHAASEIALDNNGTESQMEEFPEENFVEQQPEVIPEETVKEDSSTEESLAVEEDSLKEESSIVEEDNLKEKDVFIGENPMIYKPYWQDANFSNLVVFVDFTDTQQDHIFNVDILKTFNGDEENPKGMRQYLYDMSYGALKVENIFPQYDEVENQITPFRLENNAQYYVENEGALIAEVVEQLNNSGLFLDGMTMEHLMVVVPGGKGNIVLYLSHTPVNMKEK